MSITHLILVAFKPDVDAEAIEKVRKWKKIKKLPLTPAYSLDSL